MKINFSLLTFLALSIKIVALGSNLTDSIALSALAILYGFNLYLNKHYKEELPLNEEIKKDIAQMKSTIDALKIAQSQRR